KLPSGIRSRYMPGYLASGTMRTGSRATAFFVEISLVVSICCGDGVTPDSTCELQKKAAIDGARFVLAGVDLSEIHDPASMMEACLSPSARCRRRRTASGLVGMSSSLRRKLSTAE